MCISDAEIRQSVDGVTVEGVVQKISGLGLEVSKALRDISERLTPRCSFWLSTRDAVALEQKELERLHKIDRGGDGARPDGAGLRPPKAAIGNRDCDAAHNVGGESAVAERSARNRRESLKKQRQREIEEYEIQEGAGAQEGAGQVRGRRAPG